MKKGTTMVRRFKITCKICGKDQMQAVSWGKYCSKRCGMVAYSEREKVKILAGQ